MMNQVQEQKILDGFKALVEVAYEVAKSKGWWEGGGKTDLELIALMHSELGEATEACRKPGPSDHIPEFTGVEEELADVIIREGDMSGARNLRLGEAVVAKIKFNMTREHRHGGKLF